LPPFDAEYLTAFLDRSPRPVLATPPLSRKDSKIWRYSERAHRLKRNSKGSLAVRKHRRGVGIWTTVLLTEPSQAFLPRQESSIKFHAGTPRRPEACRHHLYGKPHRQHLFFILQGIREARISMVSGSFKATMQEIPEEIIVRRSLSLMSDGRRSKKPATSSYQFTKGSSKRSHQAELGEIVAGHPNKEEL